ncbi:Alpha/beta hydrolase fold-1 [Xylariaceae sp. FL1272]|nr:Alpha/beta hydrolase fold-1 [Xylariaceae sp. FL1272]
MSAEHHLPSVVLVPGAWTPPEAYHRLVHSFEAKLFDVHVPALPTNNGRRPPISTFAEDIAAVRHVVEELVDHGKHVLMLMHSYGGIAGTSALQGLTLCRDGTWFPIDPPSLLYQDLTPKDQQEQTKLLRWGNAAILPGNATYAAWRDVSTLYVRSTEDRWLLPEYQDFCLMNAEDAGVTVEVDALKSGHSPYVKFANEIASMTLEKASGYSG